MSNGVVEAYNGCLKTMLKRMCMEEPKNWHNMLESVLFAYREVPHEATGFSPFELLYGRKVRGPLGIIKDSIIQESSTNSPEEASSYVNNLYDKLEQTRKIVREKLQKS